MDSETPHTARVWNYFLGGKDNYAADRATAERIIRVNPDVVRLARASRKFLVRAVQHLAGDLGIRQFLDIGTGLPTANNTHEVAQEVAPESRVVYVDNAPLVLVHAHALLTSRPPGVTRYVEADLLDPERILTEAAKTLDLDQPVGLMLIAILHHVPDLDQARDVLRRLLAGLPSGSYVAVAHALRSPAMDDGVRLFNRSGGKPPLIARDADEIATFFDDLELLEPGLVTTTRWLPGVLGAPGGDDVDQLAAVARKR